MTAKTFEAKSPGLMFCALTTRIIDGGYIYFMAFSDRRLSSATGVFTTTEIHIMESSEDTVKFTTESDPEKIKTLCNERVLDVTVTPQDKLLGSFITFKSESFMYSCMFHIDDMYAVERYFDLLSQIGFNKQAQKVLALGVWKNCASGG